MEAENKERGGGYWIMLIKKLGTVVSPPKLSIHWSVPWLHPIYSIPSKEEQDAANLYVNNYSKYEELSAVEKIQMENQYAIELHREAANERAALLNGDEHDWTGARKIRYKNEDVRIFPDEFTIMTVEKMKDYCDGNGSHELVSSEDSVATGEAMIINHILKGELKEVYEAALLDGATHPEALMTAMGVDPTSDDADFPPIGWYRCRKEYAEIYCSDHDMEETDRREETKESQIKNNLEDDYPKKRKSKRTDEQKQRIEHLNKMLSRIHSRHK